jgi:hypothetical protein
MYLFGSALPLIIIIIIIIVISLLPLCWKNKVGLWDHFSVRVCVCVSSPY